MRVRFAPSPTGYLHIGNARTAMLNLLIAKKNNAGFILRIEDTDMERSSKKSEQSIIEDLKWLGIEWNESPHAGGEYGPYRQSERFDIYREYTDKLIKESKAYYCYCSQDELAEMRKKADEEKRDIVYNGKCRDLSKEERDNLESSGIKPTVRFKVPQNETITINDHVKGDTVFNSDNIGGDFIIVRSDGIPIYNYIVVIDDTLMKISHVIRGEDHLSNTPKQVLIARALGFEVPQYAHHALVLGPDRSKLSKRHGITSVAVYREEGYLPEAIANYLSMLGWATESEEEILSMDDIIKEIEIDKLPNSPAIFDFKKLKWMNGIYIRNYDLKEITEKFIPYIEKAGYSADSMDRDELENIVSILRSYCELLPDINSLIGMFLDEVCEPDEDAHKMLSENYSINIIKAANELLGGDLNENNYSTDLINLVKDKTGQKGKELFMPVRALITGRLKGPDLGLALPVIGFDRCRKRIEFCFKKYCS
ncbi:glutamate--tRNA ligase [Spirochaetota bacterium]